MSIIQLITSSFFLLLLGLVSHPQTTTCATSATAPYFSKTTFFTNYKNMLTNLKIFIYPPPVQQHLPQKNTTSPHSLLYNFLISSDFLTHNPNQATLFFLPFDPMSTRSLSSHIQLIRTSYPYWNRSLGADHFFFSCKGVGIGAIRNVVELKKNAIQVSCFPSPAREVIPHKDITLPPILVNPRANKARDSTRLLGYWRFAGAQAGLELINGLRNDVGDDDGEFLIESEPSDDAVSQERMHSSEFCLFVYDHNNNSEGVAGLTAALAHGCVPVVITDRPMHDLPLMDVIRWSEIAVFVGSTLTPVQLKKLLISTREDGAYEKMKRLGMEAAHHFAWNESSPQPYDAFYMVMYQLWLRRHAIRYTRWETIMESTKTA